MSTSSIRSSNDQGSRRFSRRAILGGGGLLMAGTAFSQGSAARAAAPLSGLQLGLNMYESIGVKPLINCRGTFTIISGSLTLPEVKQAMEEAGHHYVHLDELMEGVGKRLGELANCEWGIVTAGCSAAETVATCACIAGTDPEKMQRIPNDLKGLKNEVVIPDWSRNVYDHGVRMTGVTMVTVRNLEEFEAAVNPKTAMVYILADERNDTGEFGLEPIAGVARKYAIPLLVDAAAEDFYPDVHFSRGADMVAYSGGKALRGPQSAGLLLGRKDLCQAAFLNSAPHHAYGRSLKIDKEDVMGMLAAVEMWSRRDHQAEWAQEKSWLEEIAGRLEKLPGVQTEILPPRGRSNQSLSLQVNWDGTRLGIGGDEVHDLLFTTDPRIALAGSSGNYREGMKESTVSIVAWMMQPGDAQTVGKRVQEVLARPPQMDHPARPDRASADIAGRWNAQLDFSLGSAQHLLFFEQEGQSLAGRHEGDILKGDLSGSIYGDEVDFRSSQAYEGTRLRFRFKGKVQGDSIQGVVDLGEYGEARWTARRPEA
ncbi:MAG: aminotransferase class V-fold PLP-dependent enzyme [Acidobacteriota bacterium]